MSTNNITVRQNSISPQLSTIIWSLFLFIFSIPFIAFFIGGISLGQENLFVGSFICLLLIGVTLLVIRSGRQELNNSKIYKIAISDEDVQLHYFSKFLVFDSIRIPKTDIKVTHKKLITSKFTKEALVITKISQENNFFIINQGVLNIGGWSKKNLHELCHIFKDHGHFIYLSNKRTKHPIFG